MRNDLVKKLRLATNVFALGVGLVIFSSENVLAVWCGTSECSTCGSYSWSKREECKFDSQAACNNEIDRIRREMSVSGARFSCYEKGSGSNSSGGSSGGGDLNSLAGEAIAKGLVYGNANMLGLGLGFAILSGAMQANAPTPQDNARIAAEAAERQRLAEQARLAELQRQEDAKQRILGALKGAESSGELGLKMDSEQPLLVASKVDFFGSTSLVPVSSGALSAGGLQLKMGDDASVVKIPDNVGAIKMDKLPQGDPEHLAKGGRVVDCNHTREVYERMSAGLPQKRTMLDRYREQIANAKGGRAAISEEARGLAVKAAYDEARNLAKSLAVVRSRLGTMKFDGVDQATRLEWMRSLKDWDEFYEWMDKLPTAYMAGAQYGEDLPAVGKSLQEQATRLNQLMVDSGLAEQAGEELAKYGFGPAGALTFRVLKFGIDSIYVTGKQVLNEEEIAQATATLENLRSEYSLAEEKVSNYRADLTEMCSGKP